MHLSRRIFSHQIQDTDYFVLFNPLSGSVDLADSKDIERLDQVMHKGTLAEIGSDLIAQLRERKLLFDSVDEEESYLEQSVASARHHLMTNQPSLYVVCPTLTCNLDCGYCFEGPTHLKPKGVMTTTEIDHVFESIRQLELKRSGSDSSIAPPAPWISLFGGEPLQTSTLWPVEEILSRAYDLGYPCTFTSNGVAVKTFSRLLNRFSPEGPNPIIAAFQVTIDGPKHVHDLRRPRRGGQGSFDAIIEGVDILLSLNIYVTLRVNLDQGNLESLPELCEFVKYKGWDKNERLTVSVAPVVVHSASSGSGNYENVIDELSIDRQILQVVDEHPIVGEMCDLKHLRCLDHLSSQLEPSRGCKEQGDPSQRTGPRYWYCEQGTNANWVFTPDGHIYTCTEAVGKPKHAIGRFSPNLEIWNEEASDWIGRTILSNPKCRTCNISTLCGGGCHFAAREKAGAGSLIQLTLKGAPNRKPLSLLNPMRESKNIDPYCANAEETVRAYLDIVGPKILAAHGLA